MPGTVLGTGDASGNCPFLRADDKGIVYRVLIGTPEQKEAAVGDRSAGVCTLGLECRFK